jgi:hypothetical protein
MKFSDITGQDVTTLTEAPMGFMKTLGTAARSINPFSLSGRSQAQGQFKTGMSANQIYGDFYKWLGQSGAKATTDSVISFLQQQGYGQPAIAAAQKLFPSAPAAAPSANFSGGQTQPPAPSKVSYSGLAAKQQVKLPQATAATNGAYGVPNTLAPSLTPKPRDQAAPSPSVSQNLDPRAAGANSRARMAARRSELEEDTDTVLTKDQLSAIFTAVAQSGATPQATRSSGTAGSNTVEPNSDSGSDQAQSSNTSNQQAQASGLPARLTAEQILNYYANLTSPYERDQVKKGIAEIDKQLTGQAQQAKQQPAK